MKFAFLFAVAATLLAAPATSYAAQAPTGDELPDYYIVDEDPIFDAIDAFLAAIGSEDRAELANHMLPDGMIFVHNLMDMQRPRVDIVPAAEHLENWALRSGTFEEVMDEFELSVSWTMAHAWGWYTFKADGDLTHCGMNSLSLVRMDDGAWKVGNASFTMVPPDECERLANTDAIVGQTLATAERMDEFEANPPELAPDRVPSGYRLGRCLLEVDGETYISGPCAFSRHDGGGFMFNGPRQVYAGIDYSESAFPMGISTDYFVYLMHHENDIDGTTGQGWYASWNEDTRSTHADAYLGAVKQEGDCYTNARTKICLWES